MSCVFATPACLPAIVGSDVITLFQYLQERKKKSTGRSLEKDKVRSETLVVGAEEDFRTTAGEEGDISTLSSTFKNK